MKFTKLEWFMVLATIALVIIGVSSRHAARTSAKEASTELVSTASRPRVHHSPVEQAESVAPQAVEESTVNTNMAVEVTTTNTEARAKTLTFHIKPRLGTGSQVQVQSKSGQ